MSDVLKSLGLEGAVEVSVDDWKALPSNRRHSLTGPPPEHASVFLRLPDPPPVAALRTVAEVLEEIGDGSGDVEESLAELRMTVRAALEEFDGATS